MPGRRLPALLLAAVILAGCSTADPPPLSPECTAGAEAVADALQAAPRDVRLVDGTPLSACVRRAHTDAELQNLGLILTGVAEDLEAAAPETPRAALQLGYLIGAARRGAPSESSLQAELVHRMERSAAIRLPPPSERSLADGMRAGERGG